MSTLTPEYFKKLLVVFLKTNEPDLSHDEILIDERTNLACKIYDKLAHKDKNAAFELAKMKLFEGLELSVFYFVLDLTCNYFNRIPDKTQRDFCMKVLPECAEVYDRFSFTDNLDGENYYLMVREIQEIIKNHSGERE